MREIAHDVEGRWRRETPDGLGQVVNRESGRGYEAQGLAGFVYDQVVEGLAECAAPDVCPAVVLVKLTVPVSGLNIPPLLDQLPVVRIMAAAVPASNVPAVSVIVPVSVRVVVLPPTLSVWPDLFTVRLLNV